MYGGGWLCCVCAYMKGMHVYVVYGMCMCVCVCVCVCVQCACEWVEINVGNTLAALI